MNQVMRKYDLAIIAQVDLELFFHIGQSVKGMDAMIIQITNRILRTLEKEGIMLSKKEKEDVILDYRKEALRILPSYQRTFKKLQKDMLINEKVRYAQEMDIHNFRRFYKYFKKNFTGDPTSTGLLQSWKELGASVNYFAISSMLKRRSNQSTYSRLIKAGLI
ncbi:MAG: hypothetical protein NWE90_03145 [Candidatus Bathyarchaeota archaeon]|nr:hypothetical protein [Candidatus Bathyarchaeota archaeon]